MTKIDSFGYYFFVSSYLFKFLFSCCLLSEKEQNNSFFSYFLSLYIIYNDIVIVSLQKYIRSNIKFEILLFSGILKHLLISNLMSYSIIYFNFTKNWRNDINRENHLSHLHSCIRWQEWTLDSCFLRVISDDLWLLVEVFPDSTERWEALEFFWEYLFEVVCIFRDVKIRNSQVTHNEVLCPCKFL